MSNRVITKARAIRDVTANPSLLKNCGVFKDDRKVVSIALKGNGTCLRYASDRLRDDKRIVKLALRERGQSLKYASDRLKEDTTIVWEALNRHPSNIIYAFKRFRNNSKDLMRILLRYPACYEFLPIEAQSNFSVQLQTIKGTGTLGTGKFDVTHLTRKCKTLLANNLVASMHDKNQVWMVLRAMDYCPRYRSCHAMGMESLFRQSVGLGLRKFKKWVSRWSHDKDIMIALVKQSPENYAYASGNLKADLDFFTIALDISHLGSGFYSPFKDAPKEFCNSRDLAIRASSNDRSYKYLSTRLRRDEEIALRYFGSHKGWKDLRPVPYSIRNQPKFIHLALRLGSLKVSSKFKAQLLLKRGADPTEIFRHSSDYIRSLKIIYIPAINQNPLVVCHLQDIKTLLGFDYTKLNASPRAILFNKYRTLRRLKKGESDLFNRAAEEIRVKKMMCINPIS